MVKEKRSSWGIDKVTVRVDMQFVNRQFKGLYRREGQSSMRGINVINKNRFYYINFHDCLFMDGSKTVAQVVLDGMYGLYYAKKPLLNEEPTWNFICNYCKLSELEVYFDSYNFSPFDCYVSPLWRSYEDRTLYSGDFKHILRRDGSLKQTQHSLICIYNRARKIGSPEKITRFEYRLRGKYIKKLNLIDLCTGFQDLYVNKIFPILIRYTDKLLNEGMISFKYEDLIKTQNQLLPILSRTKNFGFNTNNAFRIEYQKNRGAY